MKLLYIASHLFDNESASIRNLSLINGIIENNIEIDIITLDYLAFKEDEYLKKLLKKGGRIYKVKIPFYNFISGKNIVNKKDKVIEGTKNNRYFKIKTLVKDLIFFPDTLIECKKNVKKIELVKEYDYIISSSDSKISHYMALEILKNERYKLKKWIQIWGDPWADDLYIKKKSFFIRKKIEREERLLLEKASKIFYISELTANKMKDKYLNFKEKIEVLERSYINEIKTKISIFNKEKIEIVYTGTLQNRNIIPLLENVEKYNKKHEKQIKITVFGDRNRNLINKYPFLFMEERVSFEKIIKIYEEADILLYLDNIGETTQIPGKIYDYLGTDKVILGLCENFKTYELLKKFKRIELFYNQVDKIKLESIIEKIGTKFPLKEYSSQNLAKKFIERIC